MYIATGKETYAVHPLISLIVPQGFARGIQPECVPPASFGRDIAETIAREIPEENIRMAVANANSLTFECTQECNLRCKYCVFTGEHYESFRIHNPKHMDAAIFQEAIDFFYRECLNSPLRINREVITVSFYGGEPLQFFDHILQAVRYTKEKRNKNQGRFDFTFIITTNGVLLSPSLVESIVSENIMLDISLDGPQQEHDRFRSKRDGSGSFREVFENIQKLKEKFPGYFDRNVRFLVTIHPLHHLKKIEEFFLAHDDLFNAQNVRISSVSRVNLKDSSRQSWFGAADAKMVKGNNQLREDQWFYKKMVASFLERQEEMPTRVLMQQVSFTGACAPGNHKLYIDTAGKFHICEKINANFSIGSLDTGFDFKKIKEIITAWQQDILRLRCWECEAWWLCTFCFANCGGEHRIAIEADRCREYRENLRLSLGRVLKLKEIEDENKIKDSHPYTDLCHYLEYF